MAFTYAAVRACVEGNVEKLSALLEGGMDIHAKNKNGDTLLVYATRLAPPEIVRTLMDNGANARDVDACGYTPLHYAAEKQTTEVVLALLKAGADVHAASQDGTTPLHRAIRSCRIDNAFILLDNGAEAGAVDTNGISTLHYAACHEDLAMKNLVRQLLNQGANLHQKENEATTPLHDASSYGSLEVLQLLLERGADVHAVDLVGQTALHKAAKRGHPDIVLALLAKGADVHAVDKMRGTPDKIARMYGHQETERVLNEHSLLEQINHMLQEMSGAMETFSDPEEVATDEHDKVCAAGEALRELQARLQSRPHTVEELRVAAQEYKEIYNSFY